MANSTLSYALPFAILLPLGSFQSSASLEPRNLSAAESPEQSTQSNQRILPAGTQVIITPIQVISSKHVKIGQKLEFEVTADVIKGGTVVIPRGSPVTAVVTFKTGRGITGKSGKFDIEFESVMVSGHEIGLTGTHHQGGRGDTAGAVLISPFVSGRSAVLLPGQLVYAFTRNDTNF